MISTGEGAAAWPLLEDSLQTFRDLGLRRGEAQVLAYLAEKPREDGDLARAIELTLQSAKIAGEVDWAWWQSFSSTVPPSSNSSAGISMRPKITPLPRSTSR